jgi:general secretion pathway protein L
MEQIKAIFIRWIEVLAGFIEAWRASALARRSVIVTQDAGSFTVRRSDASDGSILGKVMMGSQPPSSMAEALRNHLIIFEIAPDKVVTRRLTVPAQAQEFLPGIVRNQIERLSPWPPAQAVYGVDAKPNPADAGTLNVSVPIASRASIDAICSELADSGLPPARIAVRTEADEKSPLLTLWTRPTQGAQNQKMDLPRMIATGLGGMVAVSAAISIWAIYSTSTISSEHEDVTARTEALQQQSRSSRKMQDIALLKPPQRAWALKENSPVAVLTLEALSRALPDNAYLTELQLENTTLRIIGLAADAPSLIAALEQSGRFSAVHFFAPTTKGQNNPLYKFYIETRVEEHPSLIGD